MTFSKESQKRDFVAQIIVLMEQSSSTLSEAGFDPTARIAQLKSELLATEEAEAKQKEIQAASLDATKLTNATLKQAYEDASASISLIEGILGKDNSLVHKLRQLRK